MADKDDIQLMPRDLLGVIQRGLMELHLYAGQPAHLVDPAVIMQELSRIVPFVEKLPRGDAPIANGKDRPEARAN